MRCPRAVAILYLTGSYVSEAAVTAAQTTTTSVPSTVPSQSDNSSLEYFSPEYVIVEMR